ncbi:MAG: DUF2905 domain-containing protein [Anaerolineae bacterium]|nr:DUF2905 domain-containing protein [Anaerolineae bacterium]
MSIETLGRTLLLIGLALALFGAGLWLLGKVAGPGIGKWFGNLPGDIVIKSNGLTCLFPLASMLIISILLTIALNIVIRLINR